MKNRWLQPVLCVLLALALSACGGMASTSAPAPTPSPGEALVDDAVVPTAENSDTIKWLNNACSPYTITEGSGDLITYGGGRRTVKYVDKTKRMLEKTWGVVDRATADYTLKVLRADKERKDFIRANEQLRDAGFANLSDVDFKARLRQEYKMDQQTSEAWLNTYQIYSEYGENAIDAWCSCLIIRLSSYFYVVGYYTFDEAVAVGVQEGMKLQERYSSWEAMMLSNVLGYSFTLGKPLVTADAETGIVVNSVYERLIHLEENPFTLPWDTELVAPAAR